MDTLRRPFELLRLAVVLSVALALGCDLGTEPFERLDLRLTVEPAVFTAGDSVQFIASAFNPTGESIQIGQWCGPNMDVIVKKPTDSEISVLAEMVGPNAAFICPLLPSHIADPGETETETFRWLVPETPGDYEAVIRLRRDEPVRSAPLRFTID